MGLFALHLIFHRPCDPNGTDSKTGISGACNALPIQWCRWGLSTIMPRFVRSHVGIGQNNLPLRNKRFELPILSCRFLRLQSQ